MLYLEKRINNTFITGFNELKTMVSEADTLEADSAPAPVPPSPSPSSAINSTGEDGGSSGEQTQESPVVSASDDVHSWSDLALDAVNKLADDVKWIKYKANRVSFDVIHDYVAQYGFYRSVVLLK